MHVLNRPVGVMPLQLELPYLEVSEDLCVVAFNHWWWAAGGMALAALGLRWFDLISNGQQRADQEPLEIPTAEMTG